MIKNVKNVDGHHKSSKMSSKSEISEIWSYGRGKFKGYTEDLDVAKRVMNWKSIESSSIYYTPDMQIFAYGFIFRTRTYNRVARALGLPDRKKLTRRIKKDQKLQESDSIGQVKSSKLPTVEV